MLAYPTPTFDAKTILQAPGYRPIGRGSQAVYEAQPEASTPLNLVNRHTANGGYVGSRSKKFIQDPYRMPGFDPTKGTPLSTPGSVGNVGDQAIGCKPKYAEPENAELKAILAVLNGKPAAEEHKGKLSAKQLTSLEKRKEKLVPVNGGKQVVDDFTNTAAAFKESERIRVLMAQGFSREEAKTAYGKLRMREAELALTKEEDPSVRLYNLLDSKLGGTQDGSRPSNDETGLFLAKGDNVVMVKKAEAKNEMIERLSEGKNPGRSFKSSLAPVRENIRVGRPADVTLAAKAGIDVEALRAKRKDIKGFRE